MSTSPRVLLPAVCMLSVLSLSACRTTESTYRAAPAPAPAQPQTAHDPRLPSFAPDEAYISHVERQALNRGIVLRWVNRPLKRLPPQQAEPRTE